MSDKIIQLNQAAIKDEFRNLVKNSIDKLYVISAIYAVKNVIAVAV